MLMCVLIILTSFIGLFAYSWTPESKCIFWGSHFLRLFFRFGRLTRADVEVLSNIRAQQVTGVQQCS